LFITTGLDRLVPRWQPVCGAVLTLLLLLPIPAFAVNWVGNWTLVSSQNASYSSSGDVLNVYSDITNSTPSQPAAVSITLTREFVGSASKFNGNVTSLPGQTGTSIILGANGTQSTLTASMQITGHSPIFNYSQVSGTIPATRQFAHGTDNNVVSGQLYTMTITFSITGSQWSVPSSTFGPTVQYAFSN
jgi:hypothetical protein